MVAQGNSFNYVAARRIGRTTANMLMLLARVIQNPGVKFTVVDHYGTREANHYALDMLGDMVAKLSLEHIHLNRAECSVIFENRERDK
jgi:hypothetical protein